MWCQDSTIESKGEVVIVCLDKLVAHNVSSGDSQQEGHSKECGSKYSQDTYKPLTIHLQKSMETVSRATTSHFVRGTHGVNIEFSTSRCTPCFWSCHGLTTSSVQLTSPLQYSLHVKSQICPNVPGRFSTLHNVLKESATFVRILIWQPGLAEWDPVILPWGGRKRGFQATAHFTVQVMGGKNSWTSVQPLLAPQFVSWLHPTLNCVSCLVTFANNIGKTFLKQMSECIYIFLDRCLTIFVIYIYMIRQGLLNNTAKMCYSYICICRYICMCEHECVRLSLDRD